MCRKIITVLVLVSETKTGTSELWALVGFADEIKRKWNQSLKRSRSTDPLSFVFTAQYCQVGASGWLVGAEPPLKLRSGL